MLNISLPTDDRTILIILVVSAIAFVALAGTTWIGKQIYATHWRRKSEAAERRLANWQRTAEAARNGPVETGSGFAVLFRALRDAAQGQEGWDGALRDAAQGQEGWDGALRDAARVREGWVRALRVLRLLSFFNLATTVGAALFIVAAIITYVFGHTQTALKLDIVAIVLFLLKGLATGALSYIGGKLLQRAHESRQKQTK